MSHTPGPWHWDNSYRFNYLRSAIEDNRENEILYYTTDDDGIHCTNPADAPLISAAPELLRTLQCVKGFLQNFETRSLNQANDCLLEVSAAIALVEKESA